jgi:hypothetical protein
VQYALQHGHQFDQSRAIWCIRLGLINKFELWGTREDEIVHQLPKNAYNVNMNLDSSQAAPKEATNYHDFC